MSKEMQYSEMQYVPELARVGLIYKKIPQVMEDIGFVSKERKNQQQNYAFRGIEDFYLAAHPALIKHGVFCAPQVLSRDVYRFEKTNDQGRTTSWLHVAVEVEHRFFAEDGSFVSVVTWGEGLDNSDKATNKAMSGAMKYALIELFTVPTQEIEDSDRTSPELGSNRPSPNKVSFRKESAPSNGRQDAKQSSSKGASEGADTHSTAEAGRHNGDSSAPAAVEYCTREQQDFLRLEFEKHLPAKFKKNADDLRHDWLKQNGYVKDGKGSSTMIPRAEFKVMAKRCIEFADTFSI